MTINSPAFRQFMTIACCNLVTLAYGIADGWTTINYLELQNDTTISMGPLSTEQLAMAISIGSIGGFVGNFAVVPISQKIGIKHSIHFFVIPLIIGTLILLWAPNVKYFYISRVLSGFSSGAVSVAVPTLINYISFDNIRGNLNSLYDPCYNSGIIISYFIGSYLSCMDQIKIQLIVPTIFMAVFFIFPETPEFWTKRNNRELAIKSRKFYSGNVTDPESAEFLPESPNGEHDKTKSDQTDDGNREKSACERLSSEMKKFRTPQAKKAFFIAITSILLGFFCGVWFMVYYVTDIFNRTGSIFSEKNSSILISFTSLFTNLIYTNIVERFNRKTFYTVSAISTSISFFVFATYCALWLRQDGYEWIPTVCFMCLTFSCGMGLTPIPFILIIEIFPKEIQEIALAICISMIWFIYFILGNTFPAVLNMIGLHAFLISLGVLCLINALFCTIFIPETRGKSHEEIMELLT